MKGKIFIEAGNPNDMNRDYLPEAIKGSDMVVNENGNNSQVYPKRLKEFDEEVFEGSRDVWYEYVPESYDSSKKVPLVISLHGGMMTGWAQAIYSCWTKIADREGFIVLFPNAHRSRFWTVEIEKKTLEMFGKPSPEGYTLQIPPENPDENYDMNLILNLIERMKKKYRIDEGRIYMQGMSMGDMMTFQFARYYGNVLAAHAGSAGLTWPGVIFDEQGNVKNRSGAVPTWQSRCELDIVPLHEEEDATDRFVKKNREYWKIVNECHSLPSIKIFGENNIAFYKGEKADYVFREIKNRDHGQTYDDAELVWDYLFSGTRREADGRITYTKPELDRCGDSFAIAIAKDSNKAYVNNELVTMSGPVFKHQKVKYHGLGGDTILRGEYFMTPVSFIAKVLGAKYVPSDDGCTAELTLRDGRTLQFARGSIGCVVDNRIQSMACEAVLKNSELYIPIEWLYRQIFNNYVTSCEDVLYITDHYCELSRNMAHLIRDEILK